MKKEGHFFDIGNWSFWMILSIILFLTLPYFKNGFFEEKKIAEWLRLFEKHEIAEETVPEEEDKLQHTYWNWVDFEGKYHSIKFSFSEDAPEKCAMNRVSSPAGDEIYGMMYNHDKVYLANLIRQMKTEIRAKNLDYIGALEYVCSSIQFIPYTLILDSQGIEYPENSGRYLKCPCMTSFGYFRDDCGTGSRRGDGCCNDVNPFGVYSPFEFAYKKAGDCDTRALLAFTLLKEMGFDVAVMVSNQEGHSVLGVSLPSSRNGDRSLSRSHIGKPYYLWELTSSDWRLGMRVKGNDWYAALE